MTSEEKTHVQTWDLAAGFLRGILLPRAENSMTNSSSLENLLVPYKTLLVRNEAIQVPMQPDMV